MTINNAQSFQEVLAKLEEMVRITNSTPNRPAKLSFVFEPDCIGPYGMEGSQWQAVFAYRGFATLDYGRTIEEAATRLLDRLQHPENYPELDD